MRPFIIAVFLCLPRLLWAAGVVPSAQHDANPKELFAECQDHFYNGEYSEADKCFDRYIKVNPEDSKGYWRKAYAFYFDLKATQHERFPKVDTATRDTFFALVKTGIEKADKKIAANDEPDFERYVKACLLSMRGGMEYKNVGKFAAKQTLEETIAMAESSRYPDAGYIIGLTNFNGSDHAFWFRMASLPHDRELGLRKIFEATVHNSGPFVDDIWFALFTTEIDPKHEGLFGGPDTEKIFRYLFAKYPRNKLLCDFAQRKP